MVRIIPFVLDEIPPPERMLKENTVQFWVWNVLITIAAILLGCSLYFGLSHIFVISLMILAVLSFISTIYFGLAIYRVRKLTKEKEIQINTQIMIFHASTVILYFLSTFAFVVFYVF